MHVGHAGLLLLTGEEAHAAHLAGLVQDEPGCAIAGGELHALRRKLVAQRDHDALGIADAVFRQHAAAVRLVGGIAGGVGELGAVRAFHAVNPLGRRIEQALREIQVGNAGALQLLLALGPNIVAGLGDARVLLQLAAAHLHDGVGFVAFAAQHVELLGHHDRQPRLGGVHGSRKARHAAAQDEHVHRCGERHLRLAEHARPLGGGDRGRAARRQQGHGGEGGGGTDQLEELAAFHVWHALSLDGEGTVPAAQPAAGTIPHFDIAAMVTHAPRARSAVRRASHLLDMRSAQALPYS